MAKNMQKFSSWRTVNKAPQKDNKVKAKRALYELVIPLGFSLQLH